MMPVWVQMQLADRLRAAEQAYESVRSACEQFGMTKEQYVAAYIERLPPITWTETTCNPCF